MTKKVKCARIVSLTVVLIAVTCIGVFLGLSVLSGVMQGTKPAFELVICGTFSVPGMYCHDLRGGTYTVNVLEKDTEGRILYEFSTLNLLRDREETVLVICQDFDSRYVYFYEDQNYCTGDCDASDIARLKENNDWNMPLDTEKMSRRKNKLSFDLNIIMNDPLEYSKLSHDIKESLGRESAQIKMCPVIDTDNNGLYLLFTVLENSDATEKYFVIADSSYNLSFLPADGQADAFAISTFKKANGWKYGFE